MKKSLAKTAAASVLAVMLAASAAPAVLRGSAEAEGGIVEGDVSRMIQWARSCEWEDDGLAVYAGQWEGGGLRMFFDVSNGQEFNIKFKVPVYEDDGTDYVANGDEWYGKYIVDMIVESFTNSGKAVLRLWGDSGKNVGTTNVAAKIMAGDLHDKSSETNPNEVAEGIWVKGVPRANSEFDISFNSTDFFKSFWGDWDSAGSLLTMSGSVANGEAVRNTLDGTFNPEGNECETVQVYFRLSAQCSGNDPEDKSGCPEHDPNCKSKMIITEINGQSLANTDGSLLDTVAPFVAPVKIKPNTEIGMGKEYDLEIKGSPRESATKELYCDYATDVLCYERLSYKVKVESPSGETRMFDGLNNIVFDEAGTNKISVTATDLAGNKYSTPYTEVTVVRSFLLTVTGMPERAAVGKSVTLPAGEATDSAGKSCAVTVTVEDPYTKKVELNGLTFVPDKTGVYIVKYASQNEDGTQGDTRTFRLTVTEEAASPNEGKGANVGAIAGGAVGGVCVAAAIAAVTVVLIKKKKNK